MPLFLPVASKIPMSAPVQRSSRRHEASARGMRHRAVRDVALSDSDGFLRLFYLRELLMFISALTMGPTVRATILALCVLDGIVLAQLRRPAIIAGMASSNAQELQGSHSALQRLIRERHYIPLALSVLLLARAAGQNLSLVWPNQQSMWRAAFAAALDLVWIAVGLSSLTWLVWRVAGSLRLAHLITS
ncbi:hypothetical protein OH77DRAFT_1042523 [Trametes cingulata]|nr:hypothetical protein OH77DRAFT_1042523 [Trametes cingulata]